MVASIREVRKRLRLCPGDPQGLLITPLLSPKKAVDKDAIDLRLGTDFVLVRSDRLAVNVPGKAQGDQYQRTLFVPFGRYLVLPGHHAVLAATLEFIKMPADMSGMILTKSSWARTFITIETAPWVHPNFRGCLTLEIANVSETPITLYPGLRIAQMVFFMVEQKKARLKNRIPQDYLGPVRPEAPSFEPPEKALHEELGLREEHVVLPLLNMVPSFGQQGTDGARPQGLATGGGAQN